MEQDVSDEEVDDDEKSVVASSSESDADNQLDDDGLDIDRVLAEEIKRLNVKNF